MDAVVFDPATDFFSITQKDIPEPGSREVRVKVHACGLNPVDAKVKFWKSMVPDMKADHVGGLDVSGVIDAVGDQVTEWKVGDRVLYHGDMFKSHGGFAEYALAGAHILTPHPDVHPAVAAATPCAGWTAWRALYDKLRISKSDSLLVTGATGGVGSYALQIARLAGVPRRIAVCSGSNRELALELGATDCIDYRSENIVERVSQLTSGEGVTRALDCVGAGLDIDLANTLAFEGELAELVTLTRPVEYRDSFMRGLSFHQFSLGSALRSGEAGLSRHLQAALYFGTALEQGGLSAPTVKTVALQDVPEMMAELLEGHTVGKLVLEMPV